MVYVDTPDDAIEIADDAVFTLDRDGLDFDVNWRSNRIGPYLDSCAHLNTDIGEFEVCISIQLKASDYIHCDFSVTAKVELTTLALNALLSQDVSTLLGRIASEVNLKNGGSPFLESATLHIPVYYATSYLELQSDADRIAGVVSPIVDFVYMLESELNDVLDSAADNNDSYDEDVF